eukprot:SAG31_NODE_4141_length_3539_cov_2.949419_2_plen_429_part_00
MRSIKSAVKHKQGIRGQQVIELLSSHGGFRPHPERVFGERGKFVEDLVDIVNQDPIFICEPPDNLSEEEKAMSEAEEQARMQAGDVVVKWDHLISVVNLLEEWCSKEPGKSESFTGSLKMYFPRHHQQELEHLTAKWGSLSILWKPIIEGKRVERWRSLGPHGEDSTLTHFQEPPTTKHFSLLWVPLDEIRDYFGDHVGMYVSWLVTYTKSLVWPALLGLAVQIYGIARLVNDDITDLTESLAIIPFAAFLGLWSGIFLSQWRARETELAFLWGSEGSEEMAPVRAEFKGKLVINMETHDEKLVHPSMAVLATKLIVSTGLSMSLMLLTAFLAFCATLIQYYGRPSRDQIFCVDFEGNVLADVDTKKLCEDTATIINGTSYEASWQDGWAEGTTFFEKRKFGEQLCGLDISTLVLIKCYAGQFCLQAS